MEFKAPTPGTASLPASPEGMDAKVLAEGPRATDHRVALTFEEPAGSKHDDDQVVIALAPAQMALSLDGKPAKLWTRAAEASEQGIYLGSLDNPGIERLLPDLSSAVYAPPRYLVFVREGTLTAAPFDLATGCVTGAPVAIGGAVATDPTFNFAAVSPSADGTLAVRPPPATVLVFPDSNAFEAELHLVDRTGTRSRVGSARFFSFCMALSPADSRTVAAAIFDPRAGTQDLSLIDLSKDTTEPLTTTRGFTGYPIWSADGRRLAYGFQPPGQIDDVYVKDLGIGEIQPLIQTPRIGEHPVAWSHDGRSPPRLHLRRRRDPLVIMVVRSRYADPRCRPQGPRKCGLLATG